MRVDFAMWQKALNVIPDVSKEEWDRLDVVFVLAYLYTGGGPHHDIPIGRTGRHLRSA